MPFINFFSISKPDNDHDQLFIENLVNNAIIAYPDSIKVFLILQLLNPDGSRFVGQVFIWRSMVLMMCLGSDLRSLRACLVNSTI